jgi:peptidoglycan/xylan/chitin deacetylase (PgdA/CDA1 family)
LLVSHQLRAAAPASPPAKPQIILLKLDDITTDGASGKLPISPRWQRTADFIEKNNLKAGFGIIGFSLEQDNPAYFKWIKDLDQRGAIEFWNHGYTQRKNEDKFGEFEQGSAEAQQALLEKTQRLAKERLGITLRAFGEHWSGVTEETQKALDAIPDNRIWLYGPKNPTSYKKLSLSRILGLENPTFVPDPEKFKTLYEKNAATAPVLVLQGHPNQWTDERWEGFVKIIDFLKSKGCVFMKPMEYMQSPSK